jgi:cytochrome c-type biogenesis protein CcmH/NrfF
MAGNGSKNPDFSRKNRRKRLAIVVLLYLAVARLIATPATLFAQRVYSPEVRKVSESLACRCGCSYQPLSACNMIDCPSAIPLREEIAAQLQAGKTEDEIIKGLVAKHGKSILSAPPRQGFDLTAWIVPFLALTSGLMVVYAVIKTWVRRKPGFLGPNMGLTTIPDDYRKRMEKELDEIE